MKKELTINLVVDIPEWCDGCESFEAIPTSIKDKVNISCKNLEYCRKAKIAFDREMEARKEKPA